MLQAIDLSQNNMTDTIPLEIGFLIRLEQLILDENHEWCKPTFYFELHIVEKLALFDNMLSGPILTEIGARLTELQRVLLYENKLHGSISMSLGNYSNLLRLELPWNELTGVIPQELGNLLHLTELNLFYNHLITGQFGCLLDALSNCSKLQRFDLSVNDLTSTLLRNIGQLSPRLAYFSLEGNKLKGNISKDISNLTGLIELYLPENSFVDSIPSIVGSLLDLEMIRLDGNKLDGNIPREFGQLNSLVYVCLFENMLSREIPNIFFLLQDLRELELSINNFYGAIPQEIRRYVRLELLDLFYNMLTGAIPLEVANLQNLQLYVNLSHNALTRPLPRQLGDIQMVIGISANKLSNSIPNVLSGCVELQYLNLSYNELRRVVPTSFGKKLKSLEVVNLSWNKLSTLVPRSMLELVMLRQLNLSYNNIARPISCLGTLKNLTHASFLGNPKLCGKCMGLPTCPSSLKSITRKKILIISIIGTIFALCCFEIIEIWMCFGKGRRILKSSPLRLGYFNISREEVRRVTEDYNPQNLIGVGSYGSVYRGILSGG
eukprot:Gb_20438 [translate_table: standard]